MFAGVSSRKYSGQRARVNKHKHSRLDNMSDDHAETHNMSNAEGNGDSMALSKLIDRGAPAARSHLVFIEEILATSDLGSDPQQKLNEFENGLRELLKKSPADPFVVYDLALVTKAARTYRVSNFGDC